MLQAAKPFFEKHHRLLFYSTWLFLHLLQAFSTELFDDEAYYWVYSIFPSWGYFDHPPVIAVLIKAGYALFQNELGVRIFSVLLSTAAVYFADELIERKNYPLFYAICASLAIIQIAGIMAVPDTPLMFFVAAFFWLYRRFAANMNIINTVLLGICIALMLYTKYHGVLIVICTLLSNPRLLARYQSYIVVIIALLLFAPHIYWQFQNGFPSVQFHLFERYVEDYRLGYTLEFVLGQILITGPFMGWMFLFASAFYRPRSVSERALKFSFAGIYIFFLLSTMKGRAEANWTIPAFISLMVLSHQYLHDRARWRKWLYYSVPPTLVLVFFTRILMGVDRQPMKWLGKDEIHKNHAKAQTLKKAANGLPVVFIDSYQKPSKYWFYAGDTAFTLNTPHYRRNNYNFWNIEDSLIGKPVYHAHGLVIPYYYSFSRVLMEGISARTIAPKEFSIRFRTVTPPSYLRYFQQSPYDQAAIHLAVYDKKKVVGIYSSNITVKDVRLPVQQNIGLFKLDNIKPGKYTGKLCIGTALRENVSLNSSAFDITIP